MKNDRNHFVMVTLIALAIGLRILCAIADQLWLDELWSLRFVAGKSFLESVLNNSTDNNHPLNSAWMWLVGTSNAPIVYRLLSLLAGIGLVFIAKPLAERLRPGIGLYFLAVVTISYPLILYSGEARGYSVALFAAALMLWSALHLTAANILRLTVAITLLACVGVLAHGSFLFFLIAFPFLNISLPWKKKVLVFLPSLLLAACWWIAFLRHLPPGTGSLRSYPEALLEIFEMLLVGTLARPQSLILILIGMCVCLIPFIEGIVQLFRNRIQPIFFVVLFLAPIVVISLLQPRVLFLRYLLIPFFFSLFIFALGLSSLISSRSATKRFLALASLCVLILGNLNALSELFLYGRNSYSQIAGAIPLACDNPFRAVAALQPILGDTFLCVDAPSAEFYLVQREDRFYSPPEEPIFVAEAPPLSGLRLFLFKPPNGRNS